MLLALACIEHGLASQREQQQQVHSSVLVGEVVQAEQEGLRVVVSQELRAAGHSFLN